MLKWHTRDKVDQLIGGSGGGGGGGGDGAIVLGSQPRSHLCYIYDEWRGGSGQLRETSAAAAAAAAAAADDDDDDDDDDADDDDDDDDYDDDDDDDLIPSLWPSVLLTLSLSQTPIASSQSSYISAVKSHAFNSLDPLHS